MRTKSILFIIILLVYMLSMAVVASEPVDGDKFEPNNDMESATPLEVGKSYTNLYVSKDDVDYFNFTTAKSGTYIVETFPSGSPQADTKIEIWLSTGLHELDSNNGTGEFSRTLTSVKMTGDQPNELFIKVLEESGGEGYYGIEVSYDPSIELGEGAQGGALSQAPGFEVVLAITGLIAALYLFKRRNN